MSIYLLRLFLNNTSNFINGLITDLFNCTDFFYFLLTFIKFCTKIPIYIDSRHRIFQKYLLRSFHRFHHAHS